MTSKEPQIIEMTNDDVQNPFELMGSKGWSPNEVQLGRVAFQKILTEKIENVPDQNNDAATMEVLRKVIKDEVLKFNEQIRSGWKPETVLQ